MADFNKPLEIAGLAYSGPFVNRENGATFCMNSNIFWDTLLLPLFQEINMQTLVNPDTPYLAFADDSGDANVSLLLSPFLDLGFVSATNEVVDEKGVWTVSSSEISQSNTTLTFDEGGQKISLIGKNVFHFEFHDVASWGGGSISSVTNSLISALQNQNQLVLPGNGVFLMENARFNRRGGLLVDLHYNGAPAPLSPHKPDVKHNIYAGFVMNPKESVPEIRKWLPEKWAKLPARAALDTVKPKEPSPVQKIKSVTIPRGGKT
ncbi:uncharacterized protein DFL_009227 [Arthrobotrys flagrans]|uniref:Uncharacterized protein n=1 Tax=Arthrobotrys flagrans TaxID=97331 RepID=A0A436ZR29_ARTFL|nr:hypothetical protein DFL_009227 [Arthrobotrys flagrans]